MGKTLSKTNCCAVDQISSNLTISAEAERLSCLKDDEPILDSLSISQDLVVPAISLKFLSNYVQYGIDTEWPAVLMISCEEQDLNTRGGIDIVCVIETSYLMKSKERALRNAVELVMSRLTSQDRVSIVSFSDSGKKQSPLISMTYTGKVRINMIMHDLVYGGGSDLAEGLSFGLSVICNKRINNQHSFLLIFASGEDKHEVSVEDRVGGIISDYLFQDFTVFVFALDRPKKVLCFIAEELGGTCYINKDEKEMLKNLAFSCGIMESTIVTKTRAEINILNPAVTSISKIYSETGEKQFRMPDCVAGKSVYTVFLLRFSFNFQADCEVITANVQYNFQGASYTATYSLSIQFSDIDRQIEIDESILLEFYRVKYADVLREVSEIVELDLNKAKVLIEKFICELRACLVGKCGFVSAIVDELNAILIRIQGEKDEGIFIRNLSRNLWLCHESGVKEFWNEAVQVNRGRLRNLFGIM